MDNKPEMNETNIVIVGNFNPAIFQPAWFAHKGLIRELEADKATIEIIHPEIVIFKIEWFRLQVRRDQFIASTTLEAYYEPLRDLVLSTFEILEHTPLKQIGINTISHYRLKDKEQLQKFLNQVSAINQWNNILNKPEFNNITIKETDRKDGLKGYTNINIQPSLTIPNGIYFHINNHCELSDSRPDNKGIMKILSENWKSLLNNSNEIELKIIKAFTEVQ